MYKTLMLVVKHSNRQVVLKSGGSTKKDFKILLPLTQFV